MTAPHWLRRGPPAFGAALDAALDAPLAAVRRVSGAALAAGQPALAAVRRTLAAVRRVLTTARAAAVAARDAAVAAARAHAHGTDPRARVERLARTRCTVGEIARRTGLAQDAVRDLLAPRDGLTELEPAIVAALPARTTRARKPRRTAASRRTTASTEAATATKTKTRKTTKKRSEP